MPTAKNHDLWAYCLDIYGDDDVERECLRLQDQLGFNVNVVLWASWLDRNQIAFEKHLLQRGEKAIFWRYHCITKPLRWLRRRLPKAQLLKGIRGRIKADELDSERSQLVRLQSISQPYLSVVRAETNFCYLQALLGAESGNMEACLARYCGEQ